ncbi:hypothetical protein QFC20_001556 [Naganishia adeliensis]|uniref:Uncharacterized protein n=1 Tax=Naganishia adeliensis TaxID=92952 RepID=A0ACC2WRK7_9TREE|nr:hypothetical protein QFC20_001556 [Naganishia adeliensis]
MYRHGMGDHLWLLILVFASFVAAHPVIPGARSVKTSSATSSPSSSSVAADSTYLPRRKKNRLHHFDVGLALGYGVGIETYRWVGETYEGGSSAAAGQRPRKANDIDGAETTASPRESDPETPTFNVTAQLDHAQDIIRRLQTTIDQQQAMMTQQEKEADRMEEELVDLAISSQRALRPRYRHCPLPTSSPSPPLSCNNRDHYIDREIVKNHYVDREIIRTEVKDRIVEKEVPVPVEVRVEVPVHRVEYRDREVLVPHTRTAYVDRPVYKDKIVVVEKQVIKEVNVYQKPIEIIKHVDRRVFVEVVREVIVERPVEIIKEIYIERPSSVEEADEPVVPTKPSCESLPGYRLLTYHGWPNKTAPARHASCPTAVEKADVSRSCLQELKVPLPHVMPFAIEAPNDDSTSIPARHPSPARKKHTILAITQAQTSSVWGERQLAATIPDSISIPHLSAVPTYPTVVIFLGQHQELDVSMTRLPEGHGEDGERSSASIVRDAEGPVEDGNIAERILLLEYASDVVGDITAAKETVPTNESGAEDLSVLAFVVDDRVTSRAIADPLGHVPVAADTDIAEAPSIITADLTPSFRVVDPVPSFTVVPSDAHRSARSPSEPCIMGPNETQEPVSPGTGALASQTSDSLHAESPDDGSNAKRKGKTQRGTSGNGVQKQAKRLAKQLEYEGHKAAGTLDVYWAQKKAARAGADGTDAVFVPATATARSVNSYTRQSESSQARAPVATPQAPSFQQANTTYRYNGVTAPVGEAPSVVDPIMPAAVSTHSATSQVPSFKQANASRRKNGPFTSVAGSEAPLTGKSTVTSIHSCPAAGPAPSSEQAKATGGKKRRAKGNGKQL